MQPLPTKIKRAFIWHTGFLLLGLAVPVVKEIQTGYFSDGLFLMFIAWLIACVPWAFTEGKTKYLSEALIVTAITAAIVLSGLGIIFAIPAAAALSPVILIYNIRVFCFPVKGRGIKD